MTPVFVFIAVVLTQPIGQNSTTAYGIYSTSQECLKAVADSKQFIAADKVAGNPAKVTVAICVDRNGNVVSEGK